ncbi:MAG: hypothetical protein IPN16_09685 [Gemmatimonadetes bacterium]|nr:hypothetical protein [Gemmatimonadota bacterium]
MKAFRPTEVERTVVPTVTEIAGVEREPPEVRKLRSFVGAHNLDKDLCLLLAVAWNYPSWSRRADSRNSVLIPFSYVEDDAQNGEYKALAFKWEGASYRLALASSYSSDDDVDNAELSLADSADTRWLVLEVERRRLDEYSDWRPVRVVGFIPGTWAPALKRALAHYWEGRRRRDLVHRDEQAREQAKAFGLE